MQKLEDNGFGHYVILVAIAAIVVISGVGSMVAKANDKHVVDSSASANKTSQVQSKLTVSAQSKSPIPANTTATSTATTSGTTTHTQSSSSTTVKSSTATTPVVAQPTSTPAPTPTQTPLSALIAVITSLDSGNQINVTASPVSVAGPIGTAKAQPIVYTVNGQTYFAYEQEKAADFNTSASQTASTMATIQATVSNPPLTGAVLDKAGNLVDSAYQIVGYSTGGN